MVDERRETNRETIMTTAPTPASVTAGISTAVTDFGVGLVPFRVAPISQMIPDNPCLGFKGQPMDDGGLAAVKQQALPPLLKTPSIFGVVEPYKLQINKGTYPHLQFATVIMGAAIRETYAEMRRAKSVPYGIVHARNDAHEHALELKGHTPDAKPIDIALAYLKTGILHTDSDKLTIMSMAGDLLLIGATALFNGTEKPADILQLSMDSLYRITDEEPAPTEATLKSEFSGQTRDMEIAAIMAELSAEMFDKAESVDGAVEARLLATKAWLTASPYTTHTLARAWWNAWAAGDREVLTALAFRSIRRWRDEPEKVMDYGLRAAWLATQGEMGNHHWAQVMNGLDAAAEAAGILNEDIDDPDERYDAASLHDLVDQARPFYDEKGSQT